MKSQPKLILIVPVWRRLQKEDSSDMPFIVLEECEFLHVEVDQKAQN